MIYFLRHDNFAKYGMILVFFILEFKYGMQRKLDFWPLSFKSVAALRVLHSKRLNGTKTEKIQMWDSE